MHRRTFEVVGPLPELEAREGDTVEMDPTNAQEPVIVTRGYGWDVVPLVMSHPHLRLVCEEPVAGAASKPFPASPAARVPRDRSGLQLVQGGA